MKTASTARGAAALLALLLGACASPPAPTVVESAPAETAKSAPKPAAKKPGFVLRRGGGYYKDDGPGEEIPDNLDEVPDAAPHFEPLARAANKPYVVFGKEYVPFTSVRPYKARGIASWYGKKFHGQKTSIGEPYDMFGMTAAHPTLALPSYVRVTNLANGRSVIVRVTDRGPFHADRVIDLSYTAAYKLGYVNNGSTQVEVEAIVPDSTGVVYAQVAPPPPVAKAPPAEAEDEIAALAHRLAAETAPVQAAAAAPADNAAGTLASVLARGVYLQLGAFASADNAENLRARLANELDWVAEPIRVNPGGGLYRLHLGPYASRADAEKVAEKIRVAYGFKPTFVTR